MFQDGMPVMTILLNSNAKSDEKDVFMYGMSPSVCLVCYGF